MLGVLWKGRHFTAWRGLDKRRPTLWAPPRVPLQRLLEEAPQLADDPAPESQHADDEDSTFNDGRSAWTHPKSRS